MAKSTSKPEKKVIDKIEGKGFHREESEITPKDFVNWPIPAQEEWKIINNNLQIGSQVNKMRYVDLRPEPPTPEDFLTSKGHLSYHEGQRLSITFEEMTELLKEYRAL